MSDEEPKRNPYASQFYGHDGFVEPTTVELQPVEQFIAEYYDADDGWLEDKLPNYIRKIRADEREKVHKACNEHTMQDEIAYNKAVRERDAAVTAKKHAEADVRNLMQQAQDLRSALDSMKASHVAQLKSAQQQQRRAEKAESERDEWRAKWEDLEIHRASCCDQMERELTAALKVVEAARGENEAELDRLIEEFDAARRNDR